MCKGFCDEVGLWNLSVVSLSGTWPDTVKWILLSFSGLKTLEHCHLFVEIIWKMNLISDPSIEYMYRYPSAPCAVSQIMQSCFAKSTVTFRCRAEKAFPICLRQKGQTCLRQNGTMLRVLCISSVFNAQCHFFN